MAEIVGFFVACVAVLALCVLTRKDYGRQDAVILAACLCASWLTSKMIAHHGDIWLVFSVRGDWKSAKEAYPAIDAIIVTVAMVLHLEKAELWKLGIVSTIFAKLGLDLIYAGFVTERGAGSDYQLLMNVGFALEIIFLSFPGWRAVADRYREHGILDRSRSLGGLPSHGREARSP